jgi:hypothetical protein
MATSMTGGAVAGSAYAGRKREPGGEGPKASISPISAGVSKTPSKGGHASKMAGNRAKFGAAVAKSKPAGSMVSSAPAKTEKTVKVAG